MNTCAEDLIDRLVRLADNTLFVSSEEMRAEEWTADRYRSNTFITEEQSRARSSRNLVKHVALHCARIAEEEGSAEIGRRIRSEFGLD